MFPTGARIDRNAALQWANERAQLAFELWQVVPANEAVRHGRQLLRQNLLRPAKPVRRGAFAGACA